MQCSIVYFSPWCIDHEQGLQSLGVVSLIDGKSVVKRGQSTGVQRITQILQIHYANLFLDGSAKFFGLINGASYCEFLLANVTSD
jgi:hypothetical protein